jgi:hypothetical protein
MQHIRSVWKMRALGLLAIGVGCLPAIAHAEMDSTMRVERTPAFDVVLSIGPAQAMSSESANMAMSHDMSMGENEMTMQPQQADQGMAVNHWIDVHVAQSGSGAAVNDVTPTIRITDKSTGEAHDLPSVMGMRGGMSPADFHYGQNVFLPDGTYQISVLLGPADTAQFRDVVILSSPMMSDTSMTDQPVMHP